MTITELLDAIKAYHKELGYDYKYPDKEAQMVHVRELALAQIAEVNEFLNETPWKPWRKIEDQRFNKTAAAEEIIDQIFFMAAMWFAMGLPNSSFEEMFKTKLQENQARIVRGYNK